MVMKATNVKEGYLQPAEEDPLQESEPPYEQ